MAKFDESKVITALHPEKAEVGKKYFFADSIKILKRYVEDNNTRCIGKLKYVYSDVKDTYIFHIDEEYDWEFLYPYEESPKQRMTNVQLMEWLAKGNGLCSSVDSPMAIADKSCLKIDLDDEVETDIRIRPWDSEEWIEPTVDIYERDCKGKENV